MTSGKSNPDFNSDPNFTSNSAPHSEPKLPEQMPMPGAVSTPGASGCDRVRPELKAYLDGQTGWWQQRKVRAHVAECPVCRKEIEAMRDFSDNLRSADAEVLDPALRAKILAAVPHTPPVLEAVRPARRRPLLLAGAAASAALVGAVLYPALTSRSVPANDATLSSSSAQQEMKTANTMQTAAGGRPHAAEDASTIMNGVDTKGAVSESAGGAFPASAKATGQSFALSLPPSPTPGTPVDAAKSAADKPIAASAASAPISLPTRGGSESSKSPAKSVQDVADAPPVAPSGITVQVRDVETRSADVERKALAAGGKIVQSGLSTDTYKTLSATLTLKIPAAHLDGFLTQVARLGQVQSRQATPEPVRPQDASSLEADTAKAKARTVRRRQDTLIPVTVNLKSSG